jgi:hypothetical protein
MLNVREIFVLSFIVIKKRTKKMDDGLALRFKNKNIEKEKSIPCRQVVFSIVDRSQF